MVNKMANEIEHPHRGRPKLEPDPQVRDAILAAARAIVHEGSLRALGVAQVLSRAELSTRAFYRHFGSKEELVAALFFEVAHAEMQRIQAGMIGRDPVGAVAAWITGRLDMAFDPDIESDLRKLSLAARSETALAPDLFAPAYHEILGPLVAEIGRGKRMGVFTDGGDPVEEAMSIHGVTWVHVERQWVTGRSERDGVRRRVQRFCLRGLGVPDNAIDKVVCSVESN